MFTSHLRNLGFGKLIIGVVSAFLLATIYSTVTLAASATWQADGSLTYGGSPYTGPKTESVDNFVRGAGNPEKIEAAVYKDSANCSYFMLKPGTDPTNSSNWLFRGGTATPTCTLNSDPTGGPGGSWTPVYESVTFTNDYTGTDPGGTGDSDSENLVTCNINGIGWIVCPAAHFISWITQAAYWSVEQLMVFRPVDDPYDTSPSNTLYTVWANVRNFANVAFIFAFFIIIFSQATSIGISAYGIKKMIPRLIVAAVLVNLSYWVCLIAVDISNIIGAGIDGILKSTLSGSGTGEQADFNISSVMANLLAMGGIAVGGAVAAGAVAGVTLGSVMISLGLMILIPALLAIMVALVVLIGRQAVLIMLIILAPLAFTAYILPGTQDWFNRWRKLFITLLIFYPLMAVLFTGSQVAAEIMRDVSQNAFVDIFSIGVQAIPLFATPWFIQWSGGLIGRVAGMVNNPNKGPLDRMRKGAEQWSDNRNKRIGNERREQRIKNWQDMESFKRGDKKEKPYRRYGLTALGAWQAGHDMQRTGELQASEDNLKEAQILAHNTQMQKDQEYALRMAGGNEGRVGIVTARAKAAESKIQAERVIAAGTLVDDSNITTPGSRYTYFDESLGTVVTNTDKNAAMTQAVNGKRIKITDPGGTTKEFSIGDDPYLRDALLDRAAKSGDVQVLTSSREHYRAELARHSGDTDSAGYKDAQAALNSISSAISSNAGSLIAKAPDLVKTPVPAFEKPSAADIQAWHHSTVDRYEQHLGTLTENEQASYKASLAQAFKELKSNTDKWTSTSVATREKLERLVRETDNGSTTEAGPV